MELIRKLGGKEENHVFSPNYGLAMGYRKIDLNYFHPFNRKFLLFQKNKKCKFHPKNKK